MKTRHITSDDIGTEWEAAQIEANLAAGLTWDGWELSSLDTQLAIGPDGQDRLYVVEEDATGEDRAHEVPAPAWYGTPPDPAPPSVFAADND